VTETLRFEPNDFTGKLPDPGTYPATIDGARYRRSASGSEMLQVVYVLEGVEGQDRVVEYFVLVGGSERGCTVARRRLLQLFRACGLEPRAGDEISPAELYGQRVLVRVVHDEWQGAPRLRVTGYQRLDSTRTPF
jgi:Protein of unknown function (DUF669)